jgi:hypothetical protein
MICLIINYIYWQAVYIFSPLDVGQTCYILINTKDILSVKLEISSGRSRYLSGMDYKSRKNNVYYHHRVFQKLQYYLN